MWNARSTFWDEIAAEYDLELADVYAALAYYFAHRKEIDQSMREGENFVRRPAKPWSMVHGPSSLVNPPDRPHRGRRARNDTRAI